MAFSASAWFEEDLNAKGHRRYGTILLWSLRLGSAPNFLPGRCAAQQTYWSEAMTKCKRNALATYSIRPCPGGACSCVLDYFRCCERLEYVDPNWSAYENMKDMDEINLLLAVAFGCMSSRHPDPELRREAKQKLMLEYFEEYQEKKPCH